MNELRVQIDREELTQKPDAKKRAYISNRIAKKICEVSIEEFADIVGNRGHTFLPANLDGVRDSKHFICQKIFALDFDGKISVKEFLKRA